MANYVDYLNEMDLILFLAQMPHLLEKERRSYTKNKIVSGNLLKMSFLSNCLSILLKDYCINLNFFFRKDLLINNDMAIF